MSRSTVEILREARDLIKTPETWTQRADARDESGYEIDLESPLAACFCAAGAVVRVAPYALDYESAIAALATAMGVGFVYQFNDIASHADVLAAYDRAIDACGVPA